MAWRYELYFLELLVMKIFYSLATPVRKIKFISSVTEDTVESRFLEPSVSRTSRYFEPILVSLGFASLKLYNFTPDFSNPRFLETPDNSNLRKFPNHLVRMSSLQVWFSDNFMTSVSEQAERTCCSFFSPTLFSLIGFALDIKRW